MRCRTIFAYKGKAMVGEFRGEFRIPGTLYGIILLVRIPGTLYGIILLGRDRITWALT